MVNNKIGKYRITKDAPLLIADPSKKDFFGDVGTRVIKTLKQGDIIDVVKLGGGGRGIAITPYLILADGSYVIGYNAEKVGSEGAKNVKVFVIPPLGQEENTPIAPNLKTSSVKEGYRKMTNNHIAIGLIAVVGGFILYKLIKK